MSDTESQSDERNDLKKSSSDLFHQTDVGPTLNWFGFKPLCSVIFSWMHSSITSQTPPLWISANVRSTAANNDTSFCHFFLFTCGNTSATLKGKMCRIVSHSQFVLFSVRWVFSSRQTDAHIQTDWKTARSNVSETSSRGAPLQGFKKCSIHARQKKK